MSQQQRRINNLLNHLGATVAAQQFSQLQQSQCNGNSSRATPVNDLHQARATASFDVSKMTRFLEHDQNWVKVCHALTFGNINYC